jgi:PAS domain S-box-containing protein
MIGGHKPGQGDWPWSVLHGLRHWYVYGDLLDRDRTRCCLHHLQWKVAQERSLICQVGISAATTLLLERSKMPGVPRSKKSFTIDLETIEMMPLVIWETDSSGRVLPGAAGGVFKNELQSGVPDEKRACIVDVLDIDPKLKNATQQALAGERSLFELKLGPRAFVITTSPRRDEKGKIVGSFGIAIDVTSERQAQEALSLRDEQLRLLVDTALDAVVTCDVDSHIVVWNSGAARLFGWSSEEAVGLRLTDTIIPSEFVAAHNAGMARFIDSGEGPVLGQRIEIEAQDRHGRRFPVELSINPIPTSAGLSFSGFIREISDRRAAEEAIKEGEERLRLALRAIDAGAWDYTLDETGALVNASVSPRMQSLIGEDAVLPPPSRSSIHREDRDAVKRSWNALLSGGVDEFVAEYRVETGTRQERWYRDRGQVFEREENGSPRRIAGVLTDISRERELEETLLATQKIEALGAVAGGFAHDLNNVLSAIQGHASLASLPSLSAAKIQESLNVIQTAVTRGRALTQNMMMLGRPTKIRRASVEVDRVCRETVALVRPAVAKNITIEEIYEPGTCRVLTDSNQLQQAILNLLVNARDAIDGGGRIQVTTSRRSMKNVELPAIEISVKDDGRGMPRDVLANATEAFFTTKGRRGNGLGLAMVRSFVTDSGGTLDIESAPDQGTEVRLVLPAEIGDAITDGADRAGDLPPIERSSVRVLLAEDHPLLRPMLLEAMSVAGFMVKATASAEEALEANDDWKATILVLDVNLPGATGDTVAKSIRARQKQDVPVIFITGNNDFEIPDWPAVELLRKPFGLADLMESIDRLARG